MSENNKNMLRAGQLAKLAGVSAPTIKHYVNEGLIPKPVKTGKTMAYYDESCVDRIKLIKKLQREKFLPLDVIKRALDSGAAYEEELELGQAIFKSHKISSEIEFFSEAQIEDRTQYPLSKIHLLEREGLIFPVLRDGARQYDSIDRGIIEIVRRREELGLPLDHSIETIKVYRDAIEQAVRGDMRLFAKNLLGDASTKQTIKFLTEVDDTLDSFIILIRHKMLRSFSQAALEQTSDLSTHLDVLSFLPLEEADLPEGPPEGPPEDPPEGPGLRIAYLFLAGDYDSIIQFDESSSRENQRDVKTAALIMANLLRGDVEAALRITERNIPRPTARSLDNAVAALAYMFSVGEASGFSGPMFLTKKALAYLRRIETSRKDEGLIGLLARYVCGAVYTMLPDIFDTCETGIRILTRIDKSLEKQTADREELPTWLADTIDHAMLPAIEIRVNRFLAEAYQKQGDLKKAHESLGRIIDGSDADDEHAQWARLKKLELGDISKY